MLGVRFHLDTMVIFTQPFFGRIIFFGEVGAFDSKNAVPVLLRLGKRHNPEADNTDVTGSRCEEKSSTGHHQNILHRDEVEDDGLHENAREDVRT